MPLSAPGGGRSRGLDPESATIPWERRPSRDVSLEETVAKAYWVVCYRSIANANPAARAEYTKLAVPAVLACGGRYLAIGNPAKTYEAGIDLRTVVVEFNSPAKAIAAYKRPGYQAALAVLGDAAERDVRIVEGVGGTVV